MARLIFISPYLKGGKDTARIAHRTRYVATREGVELLRSEGDELPPTKKQTDFISRVVRTFPDAKETLEYADYQATPTRKSAADLIEQLWEQYVTAQDQRENFLDYVAHRPGVKSDGDHGLWDENGKVPVLSHVVEEVAKHEGNVWTPVVSIRREDAERLGYTNVDSWRTLVNSVRGEIADAYKIKPDNLRWYAGMHEKPNNIHIHMIVFSADPKEGFLTQRGIQTIKSAFAHHIFKEDMINTYEKKTEYRNTLQRSAEERMSELIWQMENGSLQDDRIEELMTQLTQRLGEIGGRKVYGYLPPQVKRIVDEIVDQLARDERVASAYSLWQDMQDEVCRVYSDELPERLPLSRQKEFKPVRNMVVREALRLAEQSRSVEDEPLESISEPDEPKLDWETAQQIPARRNLRSAQEWTERYSRAKSVLQDASANADQIHEALSELEALWNDGYEPAAYQLGKTYRDGAEAVRDAEQAELWFLRCAERGNAYAQYALGRMLQEQGRMDESLLWLTWAAEQGNQNAQYRLGALYLAGQKGKRNVEQAVGFFRKAADHGNQYAQCALGKLYLLGVDMTRDEAKAAAYLQQAASQGNEYAQYLLDHRHDNKAISIGRAAQRLLYYMGDIFRTNTSRGAAYRGLQIDRKRREELQDKRIAMGHKPDDHEDIVQQ